VCLVTGANDPENAAPLSIGGNRKPKWASVSAEFAEGSQLTPGKKRGFAG
jgi:hypothetical protein